jgi:hypothetical protein
MGYLRVWVYLFGISVAVLSKLLAPLALHVMLLVWHVPEQVMIYLLGKGPILVTGAILVFFGADHLLSPTDAILGARRNPKYAHIVGVFVLIPRSDTAHLLLEEAKSKKIGVRKMIGFDRSSTCRN